jgi:hypothetical protein
VPCVVHACDDVRARALQDTVGGGSREGARPAVPDTALQGLEELAHSLGSIESCLQLLGARETVLRDRVAIDLIRAETASATRLLRCLGVLTIEPRLTFADEPLEPLLEEVIDTFGAERRLSGASIAVEAGGAHVLAVDRRYLAIGVAGALSGLMPWVHEGRSRELHVRVSADGPRAAVVVEIAQHAVSPGTRALARFFDVLWTERPGGYQAAVELAAARRVAELHEGTVEAQAGPRGGCRLVMRLRASLG